MQYLSEDQVAQMMGIGSLGEVRQGPDGNLYQYVQGVDGLGNPIGAWWKRLGRQSFPLAQKFTRSIPGPYGAAIATGLKFATPLLQKAGVAGYEGIGALYEASDGSLYQVQGLSADEERQGIGDDAMTQMMGIGSLGEVRQGPDGNLYQYMQGVDGLGNPIGGIWDKIKRGHKLLHKVVTKAAPFIPGPHGAAIRAGVKIATPLLQKAGLAGDGGIGALYQAPDGTMYQQVQGLNDDAELRGLNADDELRGIDDDPELRGFDEGEELRGFDEDPELRGPEDDRDMRGLDEEDLRGFEADQDMQGVNGYVRQDGMSGLEAYVPQDSPQTRWHVSSAQAPEVWKILW